MRFNTVTVFVFVLIGLSYATPSVKFPNGVIVPEDVQITGEMLYNSISHSQKTLRRGVDISAVASSQHDVISLVGSESHHPATLIIVSEKVAPKEVTGELVDKTFPLMEMSRTLSTGIIFPGSSNDMMYALSVDDVHQIFINDNVKMNELSKSLSRCGVQVSDSITENSFTMNGVTFKADGINEILHASALICSARLIDQVTIIDLRSAYSYVEREYGADSQQVEAVKKMIESVVSYVSGESMAFVIASNGNFFTSQKYPDRTFATVSPSQQMATKTPAVVRESSPNTSMFHITLWFTLFVVVVVVIFATLTCGVGIDIEKDTLLYQTTALRGQPVL